MTTLYALLADAVLLLHLGFVVFVVVGGFLVVRWGWLAWVHVPCALWGAYIEFAGRICPLTPLENAFREMAGRTVYSGGFLERYLIPILYPSGLDRTLQIQLGAAVIAVNLVAYGLVVARRRRGRRESGS